jgi:hypothetical protein
MGMKKTNRPKALRETLKTIHNAKSEHIGSVTEYSDGTFLSYFIPTGTGWFRHTRRDAEQYVEEMAKNMEHDISMSYWQSTKTAYEINVDGRPGIVFTR